MCILLYVWKVEHNVFRGSYPTLRSRVFKKFERIENDDRDVPEILKDLKVLRVYRCEFEAFEV